ncbi:fimbrial outer membrane usher protein StdB [Salmonella enterica subsp. enterica serovar Newport str. SHSN011]|nr:fimbrial outer membrane usher protein StdB [Salmonella enterica subsp. enterica serovar Newport str. SHSN011]
MMHLGAGFFFFFFFFFCNFGLAYLTGLSGEDRRTLNVSWDGRVQCRLTLPETVTLSRGPLLLPCR